MPGVKGQFHRNHRKGSQRRLAWQTMRIKRRFTLPEIVVTIPEGQYSNIRKWARNLVTHGYLVPFGESGSGRPGQYQAFRLSRNQNCPDPPTFCDRCKQPITAGKCFEEVDHDE